MVCMYLFLDPNQLARNIGHDALLIAALDAVWYVACLEWTALVLIHFRCCIVNSEDNEQLFYAEEVSKITSFIFH